jgi:hypothetical protein
MLSLNSVTIVSINTLNAEQSIKALEYSCKNIIFSKILLLSNQKFNHPYIQTKLINKINNIEEYNKFCVSELVNFIETDFCLIIQPDGFVLNEKLWDDEYLKYDYIGAPWNKFHSTEALFRCNLIHHFNINKIPYIVGNGGFSLRSKKILKEISLLHKENFNIPEDNIFSVLYRNQLAEKNIKIAPLSLSKKFAIEHILDDQHDLTETFGFHGKLPHLNHYLDLINDYEKDIEPIKIAKLL